MGEPQNPGVAVIVPTYNEAANIPRLVERLGAVRSTLGTPLELWLMDDRGGDDTPQVVARLDRDWVHLVERNGPRGLGHAVMDGITRVTMKTIVVMDADLSHPPERVPQLVQALDDGADMAFGSRYVRGATIDGAWSIFRRLNSLAATWMARPFVRIGDPMSGFFAVRRERVLHAAVEAIGYKIGLEIAVKTRSRNVAEVPIHFADRTAGESKLGVRAQFQYLVHLSRLALWRYPEVARFTLFAMVGALGLVTYLLALTALAPLVDLRIGTALAIAIAMLQNYALNRTVTFHERKGSPFVTGFLRFAAVCSVGAVVNWFVTTTLATRLLDVRFGLQLAGAAGAAAGLLFNYLGARVAVFTHDRPSEPS